MHKVNKLTKLTLHNLIHIRFVEQEEQWVDLYYQNIPTALSDLISDFDAQALKHLHRQFIDIAMGLAKAGIIATFSPNSCGGILEDD